MRLKGRVSIVTGGATGLGRAVALAYAREGASVVIADIADAGAVVAEIESDGGAAIYARTDISDEQSVAAMVRGAVNRFGAVDILFNNAAVSASLELKPFEELSVAEWRHVLDVNMIGSFLCAKMVSPIMRAQKSGSIINIASGTAFKGTPFMLHYVSSKGAIISMTRVLAHELGTDDITVNAIAPGYILTEGNLGNADFLADQGDKAIAGRALKRAGYPEDLIGGAIFLASDEARFISGQILAIDGGSVYH
ncbi:SDR family NAD(P)-dependent oxidoreductase [Rhizorhabdus dicambivorans]|uniref:3-oxoacyl-ACP reductase n=1 Tax=Rhizorhabdus dicambivorans TaxID=1850238 RepID=A0A2A4FYU1_9SPHN|nr:glucose 1-dehydrogenase [Rhizorhabdus dicambivorans]ATE64132.1 3-oxoacyl-ACP reductase [Rhizorhabdus dicambivorans]PCE42597.1 3-oxoacyl-ACP reductase [Rhizorhabdus dicambivorans]